jgi:membrane-associated protease RseP (regulator of RpoE activity)
MANDRRMRASSPSSADRLEIISRLRAAVDDVMVVDAYSFKDDGSITLQGRLKLPPEQAYRPLRRGLERAGYTPYLRRSEEHDDRYEVAVQPGVIPAAPPQNATINLLLFLATVGSVIFTGALFGSDSPDRLDLGAGLMFGAALMAILITHEAGHYVVGKIRGARVSLPYFIPLPAPFSFIGTMGAVILQREPFEDRRTLLEIGIAGPLAGFIVAVPLLIIGLLSSEVKPLPTDGSLIFFGDSLLTQLSALLIFGRIYPSGGQDVYLHPIALAAWIGLLITGINLIPAGQLDGGHIAYAVMGERAKYVSYAMIVAMLILALVSETWLLWAVLLFLFGRHHPASLNQAVRLKPYHYLLAIAGLIVFFLVFVPRPIYQL